MSWETLLQLDRWRTVPDEVCALYKEALSRRQTLERYSKLMPAEAGYGYVYWHPKNEQAWAVIGPNATEQHEQAWHNGLRAMNTTGGYRVEKERHPDAPSDWVRIKSADYLLPPMKMAVLTGTSPLTNSMVGGLLGAGAGYGVGRLAENLLPEEYFDRRSSGLPNVGAIVGAGLGAVPGMIQQGANAETFERSGVPGNSWTTPTSAVPNAGNNAALKAQSDLFARLQPPQKQGAHDHSGVDAVAAVPKDAFNRAIWMDVDAGLDSARHNPYGTKNVHGGNKDDLHTPPVVGAAMSALVSGVAAKYDTNILSPRHFMAGLVGAGVDGTTARVVGTTLGTLGGLKPEAQKQLQNAGVWGGLMRGMAQSIFGR